MADRVIVGSDACSVLDIVNTITENQTALAGIASRWSSFAMRLNIPLDELDRLHKSDLLETRPMNQILASIITNWANNCKPPTLDILCNALKKDRLNLIAQNLEKKFVFDFDAALIRLEDFDSATGQNVIIPHSNILDSPSMSVKRPTTLTAFTDDAYKLPVNNKGGVLLFSINNYVSALSTPDPRKGASEDCKVLEHVLLGLGYNKDNMVLANNETKKYTKKDIMDVIDKFRDFQRTKGVKSLIVFVGGHGFQGYLKSSNQESINIYKDIVYKFDSNNAPELVHIPKVFIFQACQGYCAPVGPVDNVLPMDNTMVCLAALPGSSAIRDPYKSGSAYVLVLAEVLSRNAYMQDFETMLNEVKRLTFEKAAEFGKKVLSHPEYANKLTAQDKLLYQNFQQMPMHFAFGNFAKLYFNMSPEFNGPE